MSEEMPTTYALCDDQQEVADAAVDHAIDSIRPALLNSIRRITNEITEEANKYFMDWMEADGKSNFASLVTERTERIMRGLLNGDHNLETAKRWLTGYDFEKFRREVYEAHRETIQNKLIDELLAENKRLVSSLEAYRRSY